MIEKIDRQFVEGLMGTDPTAVELSAAISILSEWLVEVLEAERDAKSE